MFQHVLILLFKNNKFTPINTMSIIICYMLDGVFTTPDLDNDVVIVSHYLSYAHPAPAQPKAPTFQPQKFQMV